MTLNQPIPLTAKEVKEYNSTKRWFSRLEKRKKKELSKSNTSNRLGVLKRFCIFYNMTPDEFIEEALKDSELGEDRLDKYYMELSKAGNENGATTACWSILRGFYRHNKIHTQDFIGKSMGVSKVKKIDRQLPLFKIITDDDNRIIERQFQYGIINSFFPKLNERDQLIARMCMCSGLDIGEVLDLRIQDVLEQQNRKKIFWENPRNKTDVLTRTFYCTDCTKRIRLYIKQNHNDLFNREDIDLSKIRVLTHTAQEKKRRLKVSPAQQDHIITTSISNNFNIAFKKLNKEWGKLDENTEYRNDPNVPHKIIMTKGYQQPLRPKRFRGVFITACKAAGIDETYIDIMTGATGGHSKSYSEDEIQSLEIYHNQLEEIISLEPKPKKNLKLEQKIIDLEKHQKEQAVTRYQNEFFAKNQQKQMEEQDKRISDMQKTIDDLASDKKRNDMQQAVDNLKSEIRIFKKGKSEKMEFCCIGCEMVHDKEKCPACGSKQRRIYEEKVKN